MTVQRKQDLTVKKMQIGIWVVGGGLSGICATISVAQNGSKTILVQRLRLTVLDIWDDDQAHFLCWMFFKKTP